MDETIETSTSGYTCVQCGTWIPGNMLHVCTALEDTLDVGGRTCATCGTWIASGTLHACMPPQWWGIPDLIEVLERIADALEKMADAK